VDEDGLFEFGERIAHKLRPRGAQPFADIIGGGTGPARPGRGAGRGGHQWWFSIGPLT
jgi:hypothetical protein